MKHDELTPLWKLQQPEFDADSLKALLSKAKKQRSTQWVGIVVMSLTVVILAVYALTFARSQWNAFSTGLSLMIGSLVFRVVLEGMTRYRKEQQLMRLRPEDFQNYLHKHYRQRRLIHFAITPLCFVVYSYGFYLLLPYFKAAFSSGFYQYVLISGWVSILAILILVIYKMRVELRFLKDFDSK
ncbi:hypothetical protein [Leeuwenhoekiella aestuarii]|uniref:Uncharacterized protein n=1 Tax=Leeuwenhoekiella aestuarii TaxID=2249426 RepID=A0A4Q0NR52_9FLAO|nr:hypothetical protein [Leeuwenhoekiella aestuarii]RXG13249.1 hypothetical protein DSM04_105227 [Leeuwenhoekiella aestuarii]